MLSVFHIRFTLLISLSLITYSQANYSTYKIEHTLKKEYSKYFEFNIFKRKLDTKLITERLEILSEKPKTEWNKTDSLTFAQTNLLAKNYELADHYYSNLIIDSQKEQSAYIDLFCLD